MYKLRLASSFSLRYSVELISVNQKHVVGIIHSCTRASSPYPASLSPLLVSVAHSRQDSTQGVYIVMVLLAGPVDGARCDLLELNQTLNCAYSLDKGSIYLMFRLDLQIAGDVCYRIVPKMQNLRSSADVQYHWQELRAGQGRRHLIMKEISVLKYFGA
jgi:hypothetical protein